MSSKLDGEQSMTKTPAEVVSVIVAELEPLASIDRLRVMQAALALLGEAPLSSGSAKPASASSAHSDELGGLKPRAVAWLKQNQLTTDELQQVFHFDGENVEVIAAELPGGNAKEKVRNAYVLIGAANLLSSGDPKFDDKSARAYCEQHGVYDSTNHTKYVKGGNELTGDKAKGWTLTNPGLKRAASLVREIASLAKL